MGKSLAVVFAFASGDERAVCSWWYMIFSGDQRAPD